MQNSIQRNKIISGVHISDHQVLGIFCKMSCSSFSYIFHQHHLQVPVSSGTLTGLTNTLIADSFVKRLNTFQITATHSKHWIQAEINATVNMALLVTTQISQTETWLRDRNQTGGVAQRARLYLEPTKWGQGKVVAKGKICSCYV